MVQFSGVLLIPASDGTDDAMRCDAMRCNCGAIPMLKVGWIFAHPPREEGFLFSSAEVITAATLQLEAADGINDTPFVTVKVRSGTTVEPMYKAGGVHTEGKKR